jgi:hypothetical protein
MWLFCQPAVFFSRVVKNRDQPIAVLADIEYRVSIHGVGIFEDLPHFHEIAPPRCLRDLR